MNGLSWAKWMQFEQEFEVIKPITHTVIEMIQKMHKDFCVPAQDKAWLEFMMCN